MHAPLASTIVQHPELFGLAVLVLFAVGFGLGHRRSQGKSRSKIASTRNGLESAEAEWGPGALTPDRMIAALHRLGGASELGPLLHELAEVVGHHFGFERVIVRVFNPRARLFEARAFCGLTPESVSQVSTLDVTMTEYQELTRQADHLRGAWCVRSGDDFWPDRLDETARAYQGNGNGSGPSERPSDGVHFVFPLVDESQEVAGYVCALTRHPELSSSDVALGQMQVIGYIAASGLRQARLRGVLQRRELEYAIVSEQLREWQGMRDNFVANVSHELRTPLTSVKAYAETLERGLGNMDMETAREFVDVIQHEANRLEQVFDDILDVSHLEGRGRRVARDRIDLRKLVAEVCDLEGAEFDERDLKVVCRLPEQSVWMQGDVDGIRQVVEALLSNARKFHRGPGEVRVGLEEDASSVRIVVEDTGIGIPEQERLRIFERFYQVDGSATRAYGGQGLGLALCREIVGWHHGRIWVEDGPEGGSRFVVTLPVRGLVVRQYADDIGIDSSERVQWENFLQLTIHLVSEMTQTQVTSIMLVDELHDVLRVEAAVGLDEEVVQSTMVGLGEGVAGLVWQTGETILVPDLDADPRFKNLADDVTYQPRSLLSVPLRWEDRTVGVLNVNSKVDGTVFDDDDRLLLEALSDRIMLAMDSFERYRGGYRRLASVEAGVRAMLDVGRERRTVLRETMARIGVECGRRLQLEEDHLRALAYALRTYDLGLAQVSAQILRKDSPLSREERRRIEDHVRLGSELVAELEPSPNVRKIILYHHENVDGTGYPDGLRGEAIPIGARIVRLADALSALLHDRPFRGAFRFDHAEALLRDSIGKRFCPRVTPIFLEVLASRRHELERVFVGGHEVAVASTSDAEIFDPVSEPGDGA